MTAGIVSYSSLSELEANEPAVWERPNFYSSPSISRSLDACLEVSGLEKDDIDTFDFYSLVPLILLHEHLLTFLQLFSDCPKACLSASWITFD